MNKLFTELSLQRFIRGRRTFQTLIILILGFAYLLLGAFQFVPLENDGMRIALGIQSDMLYKTQRYSYLYDAQAGTYKLSEFVAETLGLEPFNAFSLMTAVSSIILLAAGSYFIRRVSNAPFLISFLSLALFQETWVSGYYPNSSMIAASFLALSLLLVTFHDSLLALILSGACFALAVWSRFDAILLGGAFLVILGGFNHRSIRSCLLFIFVSLSICTLLFFFSNVSLQAIFESYLGFKETFSDIKMALNNYSTIFTLAAALFIGAGLHLMLKAREWRLFILAFAVPLPLLLPYGMDLDSPKKLLYAMVPLSISTVYAIKWIMANHQQKAGELILILGIIFFTGQYIFTPPYELVFSRSTIVWTADYQRLRGAIGYTPLLWVKEKSRINIADTDYQSKLEKYLGTNGRAHIITHDWMANQWVMYYLQSLNYRVSRDDSVAQFLENGQRLILSNNNGLVYLVRLQPEGSLNLPDAWKEEINGSSSLLYIGPDPAYAGPIDPSIRFSESFIPTEFSCQQWEESPRFWTMECRR